MMKNDPSPLNPAFPALKKVPKTGVIYVMTEAKKHGYKAGSDWVNFGQGQPETGSLSEAPERISTFSTDAQTDEYSPVEGIEPLRQAVAEYYNRTYRKGQKSQYSAENVAISPGGRSGLTRIVATLGSLNLGHFLPDYTAYEELLGLFKGFSPIPILLEPERHYDFSIQELRREISGRGLGAILLSNPCNPTGKLIYDEELEAWVQVCRNLNCMLILDEFYSSYIWPENITNTETNSISAASSVNDVNKDPILIVDGLTKNWRYPGWRISWTIGPKEVIEAVSSAGSFLDGGASHPIQKATVDLLEDGLSREENIAIQKTFSKKRHILLQGLKELGIDIEIEPQGTFYVWGNLKHLPEPLNTGMSFFEKALEHKVITVPGEFFDVNPGKRRYGRPSRFRHHCRFSFGPKLSDIKAGLERFRDLLEM